MREKFRLARRAKDGAGSQQGGQKESLSAWIERIAAEEEARLKGLASGEKPKESRSARIQRIGEAEEARLRAAREQAEHGGDS